MEMKYVVPDMAQSFGTLEFAGESEPVFEKDKNNRTGPFYKKYAVVHLKNFHSL